MAAISVDFLTSVIWCSLFRMVRRRTWKIHPEIFRLSEPLGIPDDALCWWFGEGLIGLQSIPREKLPKGKSVEKGCISCWNIQKITEHHQCTIFNFGYDRNQSYNPGTPKKNSHMSHYSESIFFQSRCAATQLNRNKPIKASGICGSQGHWRRKSWWEKRSRGNPPLPIRNPHSMPKMLDRVRRSSSSLCSGGLASHVSKFITAVAFAIAGNKLQDPRPLRSCKPWRPARETWSSSIYIDALNHWSMNINNQNLSHMDKSHIEQWCCINDRVVCYVLFRCKVIVGQPKTKWTPMTFQIISPTWGVDCPKWFHAKPAIT